MPSKSKIHPKSHYTHSKKCPKRVKIVINKAEIKVFPFDKKYFGSNLKVFIFEKKTSEATKRSFFSTKGL